jgi:NAD(P)-dependent dehydrogenase (short-subunit alcohol dehydrogenase family)/acyl dehydratase
VSSSTSGGTSISFTKQDLAAFSEASGDRNPLHLNPEEARRTPYGQPVVFGCLGAIACLGRIHVPSGWSVASLKVEFLRPMFQDVNYRIEVSETTSQWRVRLFDGTLPVISLALTAEFSHGSDTPEELAPAPMFERRDALVRPEAEIVPGLTVSGTYACNEAALAAVVARWQRPDSFLARILCWCSYLVGMELPGDSALFSKLELCFPGRGDGSTPLAYRASVVSLDSRFGQIRMDVALLSGASPVATGQLWSYVRSPVPELEEIDCTDVRPDGLAGRVAVLTGSSRGLGAALKRSLESRGALVYGIARSPGDADLARTQVGDAADPEALRRLRDRVSKEHGRLDFLICNACPPILPLRLEPNALDRIGAYINLAISLTLAPLSEFLDLLNQSDGCAVIISSAAAEHPVREWPHYVAAKQAVEALGRVASLQYPRVRVLIVRPQKLLTTLTNTPMGRLGAASPGMLARRIADRLESPLDPERPEILD